MSIKKKVVLPTIHFPKLLVTQLRNQCPILNLVEQSALNNPYCTHSELNVILSQSSDPHSLRPWIKSYYGIQTNKNGLLQLEEDAGPMVT